MQELTSRLENKDVFIINLPPSITATNVEPIVTEMKAWVETTAVVFLLDFNGVSVMANSSYRTFLLLNQTLKKSGKTLLCLNCSKTLQMQFKVDGLLSVFTCVNSMEEVRRLTGQAPESKPSMNVEFITPFIAAAQSALQVQATIQSTPGKPHLKTEKFAYEVGIAGVISLISEGFTGSIALCFPSAVFLKVYENMTGEAAKEITPEIQDAAGELLNIIFGQAKTVLNDQKGHKISKAIPTILVGDRLKIQSQNRAQTIVLPFETPHGPFHIEVSLQAESSLKAA